MTQHRVVCTGLGVVSSLATDLKLFEKKLFAGESGVTLIDDQRYGSLPPVVAGRVSDFDLSQIEYDQKILSRSDLFIAYGLSAGISAVKMSQLDQMELLNRNRAGVVFGSGIGGLSTIEKNVQLFSEKGLKGVSPFFIPSTLSNMTAGHLAIKWGWNGPNLSVSTACTTSAHAISTAFDLIQTGQADVILAGGSEFASTPLGLAGFLSARALAVPQNQQSAISVSRPLDQSRSGFVLSDGAAAIVLESLEHATKRGAPIFAELIGAGSSADAFHMTHPHPDGYGAALAMMAALDRARCRPEDIDVLNLHATGTVAGDAAELSAVHQVFPNHSQLYLSPTKGSTGHLLGASGVLEAVIAILTLQRQEIPPALNLLDPDPTALSFQLPNPQHAIPARVRTVMTNSFGFGGTNASLIFSTLDWKTT